MKKFMYVILLDGELLPDSHVLLFKNLVSALYSFILLSIAYARKDLQLYYIGDVDNYGTITNTCRSFICDINNVMAVYDTIHNPEINRDLFNKSLDALNVAYENKINIGDDDNE